MLWYMCMHISMHSCLYVFITGTHTHMCNVCVINVCVWTQGRQRAALGVLPGWACVGSRAAGANPRGKQPAWVMHLGRGGSTEGSCTSLLFPGRWRGETLGAVLQMTRCVCFLQVGLVSTGVRCLKDLWWVWNLDCLGLCEVLHLWMSARSWGLHLSQHGTFHLWIKLLLRYCACRQLANLPTAIVPLHIYVYTIMCYEML